MYDRKAAVETHELQQEEEGEGTEIPRQDITGKKRAGWGTI